MSNGRSGHRYCLHSVTVDPAIDHGWFVPVGLLFLVLWLASAVGLMAAFYLVYRPGTKLIEVLVDGSVNMRPTVLLPKRFVVSAAWGQIANALC
jgi:hypothetical protein